MLAVVWLRPLRAITVAAEAGGLELYDDKRGSTPDVAVAVAGAWVFAG